MSVDARAGYKDRSDPHARFQPTRYPYDKFELAICAFMVIVTVVAVSSPWWMS